MEAAGLVAAELGAAELIVDRGARYSAGDARCSASASAGRPVGAKGGRAPSSSEPGPSGSRRLPRGGRPAQRVPHEPCGRSPRPPAFAGRLERTAMAVRLRADVDPHPQVGREFGRQRLAAASTCRCAASASSWPTDLAGQLGQLGVCLPYARREARSDSSPSKAPELAVEVAWPTSAAGRAGP